MIGIAWAIIKPLITMIVFTLIFNKIAKLPSENVPYPILVYSAMLPWQLFSSSLQECSSSLIANPSLISKTYFPRIILPTSSVITCCIDFLISFSILFILMILYDYYPGFQILCLPFFILMTIFAALGFGLVFSALNVQYRDFRYIVPFIVQLGIYISPVGYSSNVIPVEWKTLYCLNPLVGIIDGFRWCLTKELSDYAIFSFTASFFIVSAIFIFGFIFFVRKEKQFADFI